MFGDSSRDLFIVVGFWTQIACNSSQLETENVFALGAAYMKLIRVPKLGLQAALLTAR